MFKKLSLPFLGLALAGYLGAQEPGTSPMEAQTQTQSDDGPAAQSSNIGSPDKPGQINDQQNLSGMISNVDLSGQYITLRLSEEFGKVLAVDSHTVIVRDGRPAQMADLHPGDSATILTAGDTALRIDVLGHDIGNE